MRLFSAVSYKKLAALLAVQIIAMGCGEAPQGTLSQIHCPKNEINIHVTTVNDTKYDSWVDVSYADAWMGWHIKKAYCLKPHSSYGQLYQGVAYNMRVRGEIKLHGCASGTHKVVYVVEDPRPRRSMQLTIIEPVPNAFGMRLDP